ncbi:MAG TPA: hypothetical protein VG733_19450 [Chthoniobacteraceae bacterium]|nr:hypothetical protein [Chthoniobacteraceae bacterium]
MTRTLAFILALLPALAPAVRAGDKLSPDQFKAICAVAQDQDHTTVGLAYEDRISEAINGAMRDALKSCAAHATPPLDIDIVLIISAEGKVEEAIPDPTEPISACVAGKLSRERFPAPPRPDWKQLINIHIKD